MFILEDASSGEMKVVLVSTNAITSMWIDKNKTPFLLLQWYGEQSTHSTMYSSILTSWWFWKHQPNCIKWFTGHHSHIIHCLLQSVEMTNHEGEDEDVRPHTHEQCSHFLHSYSYDSNCFPTLLWPVMTTKDLRHNPAKFSQSYFKQQNQQEPSKHRTLLLGCYSLHRGQYSQRVHNKFTHRLKCRRI